MSSPATLETIADLLEQLGDIPPARVRLRPTPGKATERDLLRLQARTDRLYELVDGVLVEKIMGFAESCVAMTVGRLLGNHVEEHDLGVVSGADGPIRLLQNLVRLPDVSFVAAHRLPIQGQLPTEPIVDFPPDLAVEILSEGNTKKEMERKLKEYFLAGTSLVWFVDPRKRTVQVFTSPDQSVLLSEAQTLDGAAVLPGLALPVKQIFARVPRQPEKKTPRKNAPKKQPPKRGTRG